MKFGQITGLVAACLIAACARSGVEAPPEPVIDAATTRSVAQGTLVGFSHHENDAHVWRSIPFAAPPVGELRWRAPRPAAAWEGTREALAHAPWCPQIRGQLDDGSSADGVPVGSVMGQEDCLYLNIYAPRMEADAAKDADLPVMMWIHGGSNVWGRAEQYDPSALAARHNVIVAVMQYRLGPLGWFAHESIRGSAETEDDKSANFAILDQIAALDWLSTNVAAFGGDPDNITIFGESAGGHDVVALLGSPRAAGKFEKAIIQSGSFRSVPLDEAETGGEQTAAPIAAKLLGGAPVTADALRAVSLSDFFAAYPTDSEDGLAPPRIIEDGIVVPEGGLRAAFDSPETYNTVPIMTGTNKDELKLFNIFNEELVRFRFGRLPRARDADLYDAASEYQSRMWRYGAVDSPARAITAGGNADVFAYRFDWDEAGSVLGSDFSKLFGAAHSFEIPFVFGQFRFLGTADRWVFTEKNEAGRVALSDAMMSYWANFAYTGNPGAGRDGKLNTWQAWSSEDGTANIMFLDSPDGGGTRMVASQEHSDAIMAAMFEDERIPSQSLKCRLYSGSVYWNPDLSPDANGNCS